MNNNNDSTMMSSYIEKFFKKHRRKNKYSFYLVITGLILFIFTTFMFPFRNQLLQLFGKPPAGAAAPTDWPQLQYNAQHTGSTAVSVPPDYEVAWAWMDKTHIVKNFVSAPDKSLTDGFESGYKQNVIFSSQVQPIIADGKAYFGAMNGTIYAVDALTGDNRWDFTSQGPILNTAAYDQGVVVFASMDSKVYGINSVDGTKRWEYQAGAGINAAPIIANSTVYIGSRDGKFYALDVITGNKKWEYTTRVNPADGNSPFNKAPIVMPAALSEDGSTVFFGAENMYFYALNTSDGSEKWVSQKMVGQSFLYSWPVVKGDKVIARTMSSLPGAEQDRDSSSPPIETVLDGLSADPTVAEEKTAVLDWLQKNPSQQSMYVLNISDGSEPYKVAMGRVTGENKTAHPPVIDQTGQVLTYWRSKKATLFRNPGSFGTKYCSDMSGLDLTTGDRLKITVPLVEGGRLFCPEIDNGFQPTVGGDYLYLFQPFRGAKVINLKTGSNRGVSVVVAKADCGSFRGGTTDGDFGSQIIYYGNDSGAFSSPTTCGGEIPSDTRPPFTYKNAWGYSGIVIASVNNTPMLFLNETGSYAIVALRQKVTAPSPTPTPTTAQTPSATPSPTPIATATPTPTGIPTLTEIGIHSLSAAQPSATGKTIASLDVIDNKIYIGYGDYQTNTGPISVSYYDPANNSFSASLVAEKTEAIYNYRKIGTKIYAPAIDPSGRENYLYAVGEPWTNPTFSGADPLHIYDVATTNGTDVIAVGSGQSDSELNAAVYRSTDGGANWTKILNQPPTLAGFARFYFALTHNGKVYVQAKDSGLQAMSKVYDGASWTDGPNLFPGYPVLGNTTGYRPEPFGSNVVYLSTYAILNGPGNLISFDGTTATVDSSRTLYDFSVEGTTIYTLGSDFVVRKSTDLTNWATVFTAPTTARSIAALNGIVYVGTTDSKLYKY